MVTLAISGRCDLKMCFGEEMPDCHVVAVTATDAATGTPDLAYVVTRSDDWLRRLSGLKLDTRGCARNHDARR